MLDNIPASVTLEDIVGVIHGSRLLDDFEGRSFEEPAQAEYMAS